MLRPEIAYDIAAEQRRARLAQAATIAQARAARRADHSRRGRPDLHAGGRQRQEVRVNHRATLMAALFKGVNTGSGES